MRYRTLGTTDIEVSVVCQGCWGILGGWNWGPQDEADSLAALRTSFEAGVNFFDTAEGYGGGDSEAMLARALGEVRDELVIASKVSPDHLRPDELRAACERSLRNLRTDRIDLYQIHWPNADVPLAETLGALEELRAAGKIRAIGVSNFGISWLDALPAGTVASNQIAYSLLFRPPEHELLPRCARDGISVLTYSSVAQGLLTGNFASLAEVPDDRARTRLFAGDRPHATHGEPGCEAEVETALAEIRAIAEGLGEGMGAVSLAWLLDRPAVTTAIVGARNAGQARENARIGDLELDAATRDALSAATEPVKAKLGTNCDQWQVPSRLERS